MLQFSKEIFKFSDTISIAVKRYVQLYLLFINLILYLFYSVTLRVLFESDALIAVLLTNSSCKLVVSPVCYECFFHIKSMK